MCTECRRQAGLTLIELVMFIVIVGVGVTGILSVMNVTVKASADPMVRKQAVAMAEAILEEVLAKDYDNKHGEGAVPSWDYPQPGANTCPDRLLADDVDDYAHCNGTAYIAGTDTLGATSIAALAGYKATVAVAAVALGPAGNTVSAKRITVSVTDPALSTYSLSGYRADY